MIAVSESTPGPIGVNMATYVGYNIGGLLGAICATLSLVAPSLIIVCIVAKYYQQFKESKLVKMIFAGIKPAVVAFIGLACLSLFITVLFNQGNTGIDFFNIKSIILLAALLLASRKYKDAHPIVFIIASAIIGIIFKF
jgi:chromate transporter